MASQIPLGWIRQPDGSYSAPKRKDMPQDVIESMLAGKYAQMKLTAVIKPLTDESRLNKLETAYLGVLRAEHYTWIGIQAMTFKLGFDTRYTPDFMTLDKEGRLEAHETKGFMRDDAAVKLKVAARMYPFINFWLVTKDKKVGWKMAIVRP